MKALDRLRQGTAEGFVSFVRPPPGEYENPELRARTRPAGQESSSDYLTNYLKNIESTSSEIPTHAPGCTDKTDTTNCRRWIDRPDVGLVVEDLADEGWRPRRISRKLGLTRSEVITILRRTGR